MIQLSLLCSLALGAVPSSAPTWTLDTRSVHAELHGARKSQRGPTSVLPWAAGASSSSSSPQRRQLGDFELLHRASDSSDSPHTPR